MSQFLRRFSLAFVLLFFSTIALAVQSPMLMLKKVSNQMIAALEKNKAQLRTSKTIIPRIVNRVLVPHIDASLMAASVLGRQYWQQTSVQQRNKFISQFKQLVISTYAAALSSYNGDRVRFYPMRQNYQTSSVVQVNSIIIRRSGQRIPVSYNLTRAGNSWKVYDFSIENVSMVQSYRAQFAGVLSQYGLAGLIQRLTRHNKAIQNG